MEILSWRKETAPLQRPSSTAPKLPALMRPSMFPVNKLENSPTLANYLEKQVNKSGEEVRQNLSATEPYAKPNEILFEVKNSYRTNESNPFCREEHDHKMVQLRRIGEKKVQVTTRDKQKNMLPTSTMATEKDPDAWYVQFSRNIHGLRKDKPFSKLTWPPTPSE